MENNYYYSDENLVFKLKKINYLLQSKNLTVQLIKDFLINNEEDFEKVYNYIKSCLLLKSNNSLIYHVTTELLKSAYFYLFIKKKNLDDIIEILSDFKIKSDLKFLDDILLINYLNEEEKIKLYSNEIINYFDYEEYKDYYFVLNRYEKSVFNKRAKEKMNKTLESIQLKELIPWRLIRDDYAYKTYSATWKSIWFLDGYIKLCKNENGSFTEKCKCDFSEKRFNHISDYLSNSKLRDIIIYTENDRILSFDGLDDLEEYIWKINIKNETCNEKSKISRKEGNNRIPPNILLKRKSLQILNFLQIEEFPIIRIIQKTYRTSSNSTSYDISFLFSLSIHNDDIAIIWESMELDKSKGTHIFKSNKDDYQKTISNIENYIINNERVRSILNSNLEGLNYLCKIPHSNRDSEKWENALYDVLPIVKQHSKRR